MRSRGGAWSRLAAAHGVGVRALGGLATSWAVAGLLARVGIPQVDPSLIDAARPLETLGFLALILPAGVSAALLVDGASWLTATSVRGPARLRAMWMSAVLALTWTGAAVWAALLPTGVPRHQALGIWALLHGCAIWAAVLVRADLAAVGPLLMIVPLSVSGLVPFADNVVYNLRCGQAAVAAGLAMTASAVIAYVVAGERGSRSR